MPTKHLSKKEIEAIANLIKIFIPENQLDEFADDLNEALDYTQVFDELDTDYIDTTSSSIGVINVYRDDVAEESISQQDALLNAKDTLSGHIVVQRVVRK